MRVIRLLLLIAVTLLAAVCCVLSWLCPFRNPRNRCLCKVRTTWARLLLWLFRARLTADHVNADPPGAALCVANHTGYLDIAVLTAVVPAVFVARRDMLWWPVIGQAVAAGGTLFADRKNRLSIGRFVQKVRGRLRSGTSVAFFPEGTSSDGRGILPFKSPIFAACSGEGADAIPVRPFVLRYRTLNGSPIDDSNRGRIFWYGDMGLVPHVWRLLGEGGIEVVVAELPTRTLAGNRRAFALALHEEMQQTFAAL
jgi:1-acyl-sn-glycerol-3-phosphate acyltransferase